MTSILAATLAVGAAPPATPIDLFVAACMKGEVRLPAANVERKWKRALGADVEAFGVPSMNAVLTITTYRDAKRRGIQKLCSLRARRVDFMEAVMAVQKNTSGHADGLPFTKGIFRYHTYIPAGGYSVDIRYVGNHIRMETTLFEPEVAARELARINSTVSGKPNQ